MEYGWLGTISGMQQKDGFFIDEDNRILFWPRKSAPGYAVNEDMAKELNRRTDTIKNRMDWLNILPIIVCILIFFNQGPLFKDIGNFAAIFIVGVLFIILHLCLWRIFRGRISEQMLRFYPHQEIQMVRPAQQIIKPSELMMSKPGRIWRLYGIGLLLGAGLTAFMLITGKPIPIVDRLAFLALGIGLTAMNLVILWRQIRGKSRAEMRFYQFSARRRKELPKIDKT
jgi:hypothetical protein